MKQHLIPKSLEPNSLHIFKHLQLLPPQRFQTTSPDRILSAPVSGSFHFSLDQISIPNFPIHFLWCNVLFLVIYSHYMPNRTRTTLFLCKYFVFTVNKNFLVWCSFTYSLRLEFQRITAQQTQVHLLVELRFCPWIKMFIYWTGHSWGLLYVPISMCNLCMPKDSQNLRKREALIEIGAVLLLKPLKKFNLVTLSS